jgi:hypothetical protein
MQGPDFAEGDAPLRERLRSSLEEASNKGKLAVRARARILNRRHSRNERTGFGVILSLESAKEPKGLWFAEAVLREDSLRGWA